MFEAGVRSGDTICVLNPTKLQDNLIGAKMSALQSLNSRGVTRIEMNLLTDVLIKKNMKSQQQSSFEEFMHPTGKKNQDDQEEEKSPSKGNIFSRFLPKFTSFKSP